MTFDAVMIVTCSSHRAQLQKFHVNGCLTPMLGTIMGLQFVLQITYVTGALLREILYMRIVCPFPKSWGYVVTIAFYSDGQSDWLGYSIGFTLLGMVCPGQG